MTTIRYFRSELRDQHKHADVDNIITRVTGLSMLDKHDHTVTRDEKLAMIRRAKKEGLLSDKQARSIRRSKLWLPFSSLLCLCLADCSSTSKGQLSFDFSNTSTKDSSAGPQ
jgi:hypothetical protein